MLPIHVKKQFQQRIIPKTSLLYILIKYFAYHLFIYLKYNACLEKENDEKNKNMQSIKNDECIHTDIYYGDPV